MNSYAFLFKRSFLWYRHWCWLVESIEEIPQNVFYQSPVLLRHNIEPSIPYGSNVVFPFIPFDLFGEHLGPKFVKSSPLIPNEQVCFLNRLIKVAEREIYHFCVVGMQLESHSLELTVLDMGNVWMARYLAIEILNSAGYKAGGAAANCMRMTTIWLTCVSRSERIVRCVCVIIGPCMLRLLDNLQIGKRFTSYSLTVALRTWAGVMGK